MGMEGDFSLGDILKPRQHEIDASQFQQGAAAILKNYPDLHPEIRNGNSDTQNIATGSQIAERQGNTDTAQELSSLSHQLDQESAGLSKVQIDLAGDKLERMESALTVLDHLAEEYYGKRRVPQVGIVANSIAKHFKDLPNGADVPSAVSSDFLAQLEYIFGLEK